VVCNVCHGSGYRFVACPAADASCAYCGGKGEKRCHKCNGTGSCNLDVLLDHLPVVDNYFEEDGDDWQFQDYYRGPFMVLTKDQVQSLVSERVKSKPESECFISNNYLGIAGIDVYSVGKAEYVARYASRLSAHDAGFRFSPTEDRNLFRFERSGEARRWVKAHIKGWDHQDWTDLLRTLKDQDVWPLREDDLGRMLERIRDEERS